MSDNDALLPRIAEWMNALARQRPVFHSEFDFQLALSLVMEKVGVERIRLERLIQLGEQARLEVDIMAYLNGLPIALELKYPKERFVGRVKSDGHDEEYHLPTGGAFDIDARNIWKDVSRIETLIDAGEVAKGAVVVLSNCPFWQGTLHKEGTQAFDFRLWEGREVSAHSVLRFPENLTWYREKEHGPVELVHDYRCHWHPYSIVEGGGKTEFKYMVLEPGGSTR